LAALFAALALAWMVALPSVLSSWVRNRTGFDLAVQSLMVNPFTGDIRARGLVINNPPTFPQPEFLQVREFAVEAEMWSLFSDKPVLNLVKMDIGLVALVKRPDGKTNTEVFRGYLALAEEAAAPIPTSRGPDTAGKEFLIKKLQVRFDRLLVADNTGKRPIMKEYLLKIDRTYENVTDGDQLLLPGSLDQVFALGGAVGSLLPDDVGRILDETLKSGSDLLKKVTDSEVNPFKGFSDTLEESKKP
jgi:hypothetical protein